MSPNLLDDGFKVSDFGLSETVLSKSFFVLALLWNLSKMLSKYWLILLSWLRLSVSSGLNTLLKDLLSFIVETSSVS